MPCTLHTKIPAALALSLALIGTPLAAQDTRALAEAYVALPPMQAIIDQMFAPDVLRAQFLAVLPGSETLPADKLDQIVALTSEAYSARLPQIIEIMIDSSSAVFSEEELKALIAFYSTEAGAATVRKSPMVMKDVATRLTQTIREVQIETVPKIEAILQE